MSLSSYKNRPVGISNYSYRNLSPNSGRGL